MKTFAKLVCCSLFSFLGIVGMKSTTTDVSVLPTQTVTAGTITSSFPALSLGQVTPNKNLNIFDPAPIDTLKRAEKTVEIKSNNPHGTVKAPVRVATKTRTKYKYLLFIATPRDREEIPLDSVLADSTGWRVQRATCMKVSKDVIHSVRD